VFLNQLFHLGYDFYMDRRSNVRIRPAELTDAAAIVTIYNHYVRTTTITFEEAELDAEEMAVRIADVHSRHLPWYVAIEQDAVVGYAYATPWRSRSAYRFAVEVTVYLAPGRIRKGIGTSLYAALLHTIRSDGFHTAIAGIALPNAESLALHERYGFERVAHFKQVGFKFDCWIDVEYWQLTWNTSDHHFPLG
jgi:L-amino acid N-acyltransferase YncA